MTTHAAKKRMKRLICRVFGHDPSPIAKVTHADGTAVYQSHPHGNLTGCHRCRRVLKENR